MIRLLEAAAARTPSQPAVITPEGVVSYDDLLAEARRVAAALTRRGIARFAIVEPDAAWVLRLLGGAAAAGVEPCQYQPDIDATQFAEQAATLAHEFVVSRRADLVGDFTVIRPEELLADSPDAASPAQAPASDGPQPLMIRTTGTTGLPKAARHDWSVLARTALDAKPRPEQRWLLAYGPHQFAGIQVLQHVVSVGATLVAPFPRQPRDGLDALLAGDLTCVSATPTYWRFLLAEARSRRVSLPALSQITLGGEASSPDLLTDLQAAFPSARISQIYASTEFGSIASVRDGRPGLSAGSLWSDTNPDGLLRVIDGELWVRAGTGMLGYAGDVPEPGDTAGATADDTDAGWKPTGDLVDLVEDRVVFRGRTSEVINVGGVKVHPLPVEDRITPLPSVAMARVFGRPNRLTGAIVAVEIVPEGGLDGADTNEIRRQISAALADLPPAWHPRSVKLVASFETRGEKTVRGLQD
ncbi:class I adenylate-forming enzyme family protein [Nocardioides sp. WS12]|uniref:class I adenylate-forming enzyme family protein n=1 Tax=Nocardioides sp. WS12 TaxID=2486272 RepID=UPI0015FD8A2D|nr:class I adenylate-forming enzyme family protein [Nocardioides sp. WS12]